MKKQAAIFVRCSTDLQDYERQIKDLEAYAERHSLQVVSHISEKISGAANQEDRRGISELLEQARSGKFQHVLVTEISRIGRKPLLILQTLEELAELKINVHLLDMNLQTLGPDGKVSPMAEMLLYIGSLWSKIERDGLITRIKSGISNYKSKHPNKTWGRKKGSCLSSDEILKKYPGVVRDLKEGLSIRKIAKIREVSTPTVQKVKLALVQYSAEMSS